jgi:hypothetical protein
MANLRNCKHGGYKMVAGQLVCASCGEPSPSKKWESNVFGRKATDQRRTENKAAAIPDNK